MRRKTSVAGYFYPSEKEEIISFIQNNELHTEKSSACAVIVPHAGYVYSGATAVRTLSQINIPDTVILIGPNHTGYGVSLSVWPEGEWETPLGDMKTDDEVIDRLCESGIFVRDTAAQVREHSLEVILPIIKYYNPQAKIVCITMKFASPEIFSEASDAINLAIDGKKILLVISSDFNHFENTSVTEKKDTLAIESLLKMDETTLYNRILDYNISMCGVIPACIGLIYCKTRGCNEAILVEHTNSGAASGDFDRVVGYAGIIFRKKG